MKMLKFSLLLAAGMGMLSGASAQNYSIDWYSIDGGGGTSSGGPYTIAGSIGQPDAGVMAGGNYSLTGGFWSIISAIQTPGAPYLSIFPTSTNTVVISWPAPATGFSLQQNSDLKTTAWSGVSQTPSQVGTNKVVILQPTAGQLYFRLAQ
jgi:hypothetical protein